MITVIIPTYKRGGILSQTLPKYGDDPSVSSIIVVDDGSTDDTAAVIAGLQRADPRIQYLRNGPRDLTPLLLLLAASILLLQRFWLFARVPWIMPIVMLALLAALAQGTVAVQRERLLSYLGFGSLALAATLIHGCLGDVFSPTSIAYLLVIYSVFVLTPTAPRDQTRLLQLWQSLSLLCALLGILQFAVFLATRQVFDVSELLPAALIANPGHNTIDFDPTHTFLRANGMIFLEASFYSQFMALALVIEATFMRNPYRLGCFLIALFCALSGTGILLVGVALLAAAMTYRGSLLQPRVVIAFGGAVLALLLVLFLVPDLQQYFADRMRNLLTLEARDTSAYIRFIGPWAAVYELFETGLEQTVLGLGPGLFTVRKLQMPIAPNLNPISQMTVYYGIFAAIAFAVFLFNVSVRRYTRAQWVVMITVLFQYLFCAGSLLAPAVTYVLLWFTLVFHPSSPATPAEVDAA